MLHRYGETSSEYFSNLIRDISDELADGGGFEDVRKKFYAMVVKKGTKYTTALCNSYVVAMLLELWKFKDYFANTSFFMPTWIHGQLMRNHGAVSEKSILFL